MMPFASERGWTTWLALGVGCSAAVAGCVSRKTATTGVAGSPFTLVTIERKPCYGTCPVYLLSIAGDGTMVFEGRKHVDSLGKVTLHIGGDEVKALQALIADHQFYELADRYGYGEPTCPTYAADAPIVIITVTTTDRVKRVEHDAGCTGVPARLADLEQKIDELAGTARFIGRQSGK